MQDRIKELETENEELQSRLDEISDIVSATRAEDEDQRKRKTTRGNELPRPVCGASWRKPAHQITDRAKRYRANAPECCPPLPAGVRLCGSTRFVVVDHIDGDESNGAPENLRWLCKSCNTRLGIALARAGIGKRTRQYNPGARTLAQYTEAVLQHKRGRHDAGGKIIHETPKERRLEFAAEIWRRRRARGTDRRTPFLRNE